MRSLTAKFIEAYNVNLKIDTKFKNSKDVRDFLIKYIERNSTPKSKSHIDYGKNLSIVVNQLLSYSINGNKIEEIKKNILLKILNNKTIDINDESKKIRLVME